MIRGALEASVRRAAGDRDIAVAFSGGLDSGLIAHHAGRCAASAKLYVAGAEGSHDVLAAVDTARRLDMQLEVLIFDEDSALSALEEMVRITGTANPLILAFEIPLFMVCRACAEADILTGQGSDEVFGGYSKYSGLGPDDFSAMRSRDLVILRDTTLPHEAKVAESFGKRLHYPYLDPRLTEAADVMGAAQLMPRGELRKEILRKVAEEEGLGFLAEMPKKAAQYGSGFTGVMEKVCRRRGIRFSDLVAEMVSDRRV